MPEAVVRQALARSRALRNLTVILHRLAFPLPPFERFYRDHMRRLMDLVAETNPLDEQGRAFNHQMRPQRQAQPRGPLTWAWVLPDVTGPGSGGHRTVFRMTNHLLRRGHRVRLHINLQSYTRSVEEMRAYIASHYGDSPGLELHLSTRDLADSDILVATGWETAYTVFRQTNTRFKVYLVQDFEPWFQPMNALALFAENTYRMNLFGCCSSPWLDQLTRGYGMTGMQFHYGYDEKDYFADASVARDPNLVAVYLRPMTGRRGYELVSLALARLKQKRPQTRIVVFGNTEPIPNLPFAAEQVGSLKDAALADLFRRAAVVMVASLTNYSIIPVEAMACGALVVDVDRPSVSSMFRDGEELLLAPVHVPGLADTLQRALDDESLRRRVTATAAARLERYRWPDILAGVERDLLDAYYR